MSTSSRRQTHHEGAIDLTLMNKWRVALYDKVFGIVVVDVNASSETEAKGIGHRIATEELNCKELSDSCIARVHAMMPAAWRNFKASDSKLREEEKRLKGSLTEALDAKPVKTKFLDGKK